MTSTEIAQAKTPKLIARERQLLEAKSYEPGYLLEAMADGSYDAAEAAKWQEITEIRAELSHRDQPGY